MTKSKDNAANNAEPKYELESQFILRLPPEPARCLRDALRNNALVKDRLTIKLENDMRHGEVRFDNWLLHGKVVDLPTIVESLKTIDSKSMYKTADICQMLICKEEEDPILDEESPARQKKKDPNKVDKKFLWPHGITPPTKNVRRRRFRKTLKKKYVEAPEIEKEVKRLLRVDNEAVNVTWEVICEDEDQNKTNVVSSTGMVKPKKENNDDHTEQSVDVAEHDIFGEAVSDSEDDDEETNINVMELDENSRISGDIDLLSRVSDSNSMQVESAYLDQSVPPMSGSSSATLVTEFSKDMFETEEHIPDMKPTLVDEKLPKIENYEGYSSKGYHELQSIVDHTNSVQHRIKVLNEELLHLQSQKRQQEAAIENTENMTLKHRFQEILDNIILNEAEKLQELNDLTSMIDSNNQQC